MICGPELTYGQFNLEMGNTISNSIWIHTDRANVQVSSPNLIFCNMTSQKKHFKSDFSHFVLTFLVKHPIKSDFIIYFFIIRNLQNNHKNFVSFLSLFLCNVQWTEILCKPSVQAWYCFIWVNSEIIIRVYERRSEHRYAKLNNRRLNQEN